MLKETTKTRASKLVTSHLNHPIISAKTSLSASLPFTKATQGLLRRCCSVFFLLAGWMSFKAGDRKFLVKWLTVLGGEAWALKMVSIKTAQVSLLAFISRTSKWNFFVQIMPIKMAVMWLSMNVRNKLDNCVFFLRAFICNSVFPSDAICLLLSRLTQFTQVQTNYWPDKNLHGSAFCLQKTSGTVEVFGPDQKYHFWLVRFHLYAD